MAVVLLLVASCGSETGRPVAAAAAVPGEFLCMAGRTGVVFVTLAAVVASGPCTGGCTGIVLVALAAVVAVGDAPVGGVAVAAEEEFPCKAGCTRAVFVVALVACWWWLLVVVVLLAFEFKLPLWLMLVVEGLAITAGWIGAGPFAVLPLVALGRLATVLVIVVAVEIPDPPVAVVVVVVAALLVLLFRNAGCTKSVIADVPPGGITAVAVAAPVVDVDEDCRHNTAG